MRKFIFGTDIVFSNSSVRVVNKLTSTKFIFEFPSPSVVNVSLSIVIKGTEVLVVNALRIEKHISHFTLAEALEFIKEINPKQAYLTHASHLLGLHKSVSEKLPENVFLAYDGLQIEI